MQLSYSNSELHERGKTITTKLLLIGGAKAAGKSIVRGTLDGHDQCLISPFHELFPEALLSLDFNGKTGTNYEVIKCLEVHGKLDQLRQFLKNGYLQTELGGGYLETIKFGSDPDKFEMALQDISKSDFKKYASVSDLLRDIYLALFSAIELPYSTPNLKYYGTMTTGYCDRPKSLLDCYPDCVYVGVERVLLNIMAGLCSREDRERHVKSYMNYEFILETVKFQKNQRDLEKRFPDQVKIFRLEDILSDFSSFASALSSFLKIDETPALSRYSFLGREIQQISSKTFFEGELDNYSSTFSTSEIRNIEKMEKDALAQLEEETRK